ncbi:MAG: DNA polymerase IV [Candidatus Staskawiczbacteria bacterium]
MTTRIIAHLDMDAFFASLEEVATPGFKDKPIAVGADPEEGRGRGVVSTANYKARAYGIHSALPISTAWRISQTEKAKGNPEVIFVTTNFEMYEKASENVFNIIKKYSGEVEPASIDEFYFDLSFAKTFSKAEKTCKKIKAEIRKKEKVTCSIGIGPNKLVAKIAAGINKPDGILAILPKKVESFLDPLPIRKIPGIGPKTADIFYNGNVQTIKDLKKFSKEELIETLGKCGEDIYYKSRGVDDSLIVQDREVKSIGEQITFEQDTLQALFLIGEFEKIRRNVFKRFRESGFDCFKTITIVVRFADFETKTSSKSFKKEIKVEDNKIFEIETLKLILPFLDQRSNPRGKLIRLIGVRIENLEKVE